MVATNLAVRSRRGVDGRAALVDIDLQFGDAAAMLHVESHLLTIADLAAAGRGHRSRAARRRPGHRAGGRAGAPLRGRAPSSPTSITRARSPRDDPGDLEVRTSSSSSTRRRTSTSACSRRSSSPTGCCSSAATTSRGAQRPRRRSRCSMRSASTATGSTSSSTTRAHASSYRREDIEEILGRHVARRPALRPARRPVARLRDRRSCWRSRAPSWRAGSDRSPAARRRRRRHHAGRLPLEQSRAPPTPTYRRRFSLGRR